MAQTQIPADVAPILARCRGEGNRIYLPGQLDRVTYDRVNRLLELMGAKWDRKAKAHLLPADMKAAALIAAASASGEIIKAPNEKKDFEVFETPTEIATEMARLAEIDEHSIVLEPSAGGGRLVQAALDAGAARVQAIEIRAGGCAALRAFFGGRIDVLEGDFLKVKPEPRYASFDVVLMNPPFARQADVDHVTHAWSWLRPGGRLVAIMSPSWTFRKTKKAQAFCELAYTHGYYRRDLPAGTFKDEGTNVATKLIAMKKPA